MTHRTRTLPQAIFTNQLMLVVLSMFATSLFIFFILQYDLERRAERDSLVLAKAVRDQVQGFLNTPQLLMRGLELQIETEATGSEKIWNHRMDRLIDFSDLFDAIYLLDTDNQVVSVGLPQHRRSLRKDYLGINRRGGFIEAARVEQLPQWSDTFLSLVSSTSLALALPLSQDRVLVGHIRIDQLSHFVERIEAGNSTLNFIVDSHGQLIAAPDASLAQQQFNISNAPLIANALEGQVTTGRLNFLGNSYLATSQQIPEMNWVVVSARPMDSIREDIQKTLMIIMLGALFSVVMAVILSRYIALKLGRPFTRFIWATEQLRNGDYSVEFPHSTIREVEQLNQAMVGLGQELQQQQQSLAESERNYRALVDRVPCVVYRANAEGQIEYIGEPIQELTGYEPFEFVQAPRILISDLVHPDDQFNRSQVIEENLRQQSPWHVEYRLIDRDGSIRWVYEEGNCSIDEHSRQQTFDVMIIDTTNLKKAEQDQQQQIELMTTLLNTVPSPIFYKDKHGAYMGCNRAFEQFFDVSTKQLVGSQTDNKQLPHSLRVLAEDESHLLRHSVSESDDLYLRMDGQARYITLKRASFVDIQGDVAGLVGVVYDLTERVQAERESQQLRLYLSNVIDAMPSQLFALSDQLGFLQANLKGRQRMHDAGVDQISTDNLLVELGLQRSWLEQALREGKTSVLRRQQHGSSQRYEDITLYPLDASVGGGAVLRIDDVTDQVLMEETMVQSEKMLSVGGLAAGMAHEINNPLAGILQNIQVVRNRLSGELAANQRAAEQCMLDLDRLQSYLDSRSIPSMLDDIEESGQRAAKIVENMLSFSRMSGSGMVQTRLDELIDKTLELALNDYDLKKNYDFRNVQIERRYQLDEAVYCIPSKLQQVFFNLLKNSAQAMIEQGSDSPLISISIQHHQEWVKIVFEDNGPGIPAESVKQVFNPFYTTKDVGVGTGLGLSVSYFIITENHHGKMWAEPNPAGGARFVIQLPLEQTNEEVLFYDI